MEVITFLWHLLFIYPITNILIVMARVFGGNYGVAIIVFTVVSRVVLWPLTSRQYKQSRAMQAIQPKMQELQKKYKGKDPKKLQSETMALYKEAGVNPLGCILPMVAQMPLWFALYDVIRVSLGTAPETLVYLSQHLYPVAFIRGTVPVNNNFLWWNLAANDNTLILPVLVALTMYVQQKMITPPPAPTGNNSAAAQQQQTQQMMTWMMPLIFGWFTLNVPAGLGLYWFVSNLVGMVLQYFYMGRDFEWASLLRLNPTAAPTPAARRNRPEPAPAERDGEDDARERESGDENLAEDGVPATISGSQGTTRRKRHGRRRGKR
ncbi:MAG TPA: YidC/Oxa1 family membrane protein insertase [Dehalococcoidia bacterium]|nr:YidC/Oxa1 family membrane protein insertase [Dehalococcoidia bacterium]